MVGFKYLIFFLAYEVVNEKHIRTDRLLTKHYRLIIDHWLYVVLIALISGIHRFPGTLNTLNKTLKRVIKMLKHPCFIATLHIHIQHI